MKNKPYAILCADLHIREDQPVCRTDNYFAAQEKKLRFIFNLSKEHACPIYCAGDFFDKAKSSKRLEIFIMELIKEYDADIYCIPGNHDLPCHNLDELNNSSLGILEGATVIKIIKTSLGNIADLQIENKNIYISHKYIDKFWLDANCFYKSFPVNNDCLYLFGDNHNTIVSHVCEDTNTVHIVNPGSMMRMTADQVEHKPCIFLYYAKNNKIEKILLPIKQNIISREHIEKKEIENKQMTAFIKRMNLNYNIGFDFKNNMDNHLKTNPIKKSVEEKIWRFIE